MSVPVAFTGVILIWSTTPLAIQWSSEGGGFLFAVTARMVLGLVFCWLAIRLSATSVPWHARARAAYVAAAPAFLLTWCAFGAGWPEMLPQRAVYSILYLALFGSVLGFFWYFYLLRRVEAVKVSLLTLVTPVTALLLGHWLNGEAVSVGVWVGTGLILLGLALHQLDLQRRRVQP